MGSTIAGSVNDNINMGSTIAGSVNDNINMDSTIAGSVNDNINMGSTMPGPGFPMQFFVVLFLFNGFKWFFVLFILI
jgi:hypothetical protein